MWTQEEWDDLESSMKEFIQKKLDREQCDYETRLRDEVAMRLFCDDLNCHCARNAFSLAEDFIAERRKRMEENRK